MHHLRLLLLRLLWKFQSSFVHTPRFTAQGIYGHYIGALFFTFPFWEEGLHLDVVLMMLLLIYSCDWGICYPWGKKAAWHYYCFMCYCDFTFIKHNVAYPPFSITLSANHMLVNAYIFCLRCYPVSSWFGLWIDSSLQPLHEIQLVLTME